MFRASIILLLFLFLWTCELFVPRDSEPPINTNDPYAWKPPTAPEIVLENLANAFPAHKTNYYLDGLSFDPETALKFSFLPDQSVATSQPGIFTDWGYAEEENFITQLFQILNENDLQRLEWTIQQSSSLENRYEIIADYMLSFSYQGTRSPLPNQLKGQAILTLVQNTDQLYQVSLWQDSKNDTLPCWSDLKALIQ